MKMEQNIFGDLKKRNSALMSLFNMKNTEILNVAFQAPSPSKNYYQLIMTHSTIILRWWEISRRSTTESRYPGESKATYEEFIDDNLMQSLLKPFSVIYKYVLRQ